MKYENTPQNIVQETSEWDTVTVEHEGTATTAIFPTQRYQNSKLTPDQKSESNNRL